MEKLDFDRSLARLEHRGVTTRVIQCHVERLGPLLHLHSLQELHSTLMRRIDLTACPLPDKPSKSAFAAIASTTNVTCVSKSTPNSAAPRTKSSRLTPCAKRLSFIFFRTAAAVTSATARDGRTSATALMKPV